MKRSQPPPTFFAALLGLGAAFWQRRVVQWLVRAIWLALLSPTIFMTGYLWLGWQVQWYYWFYPMLLIGFLSVLWSMRPIKLKTIAYRLDNRLGLRSQLITAFEVSQFSHERVQAENPIIQGLLQTTVDVIAGLRRRVRFFSHNLWLEIQALIGVAAIFGALLLLDAFTPQLPDAPPAELPPAGQEPTAEEVIPPNPQLAPPPPQPEEIQDQTTKEDQLRRTLQILADALRDQALTRSVAEAIDRDDLNQAAEDLRRLADRLGDVSKDARDELGDNLQEAADKIGDSVPKLTQPLQAGSQALDANDLGGASQSLEDLAEVLDQIEQSPPESAQEEEPPPPPPPPSEDERLAIEGQPLELEPDPPEELDDSVLQPSELDIPDSGERTQDSPFARQSTAADTELGADPLTYPWEKREIIRRYFTP